MNLRLPISIKRALLQSFYQASYLFRKCLYSIRFFGRAIEIHPSSQVSRRSIIATRGGGSIVIGRNCYIHDYAMILTYGGQIEIGDHCSLNPFAIVYGHGGVRIGRSVRIAAHTVIIPANHNAATDGVPLYQTGVSAVGISIEDNVWLGAGARVLDGVHIGRNAIVGAGSVVTRSVAQDATVAGAPARIIKQR